MPREPFVPAWFQTLVWVTEMLPKRTVFTFFFILLLITEALSLPIFRPCAWIWRRPVHNSVRKPKVVSFCLYCWDRLMGKHCKSSLVLNPLTCHSLAGGRWIIFFFCCGEKITRQIVYMWEGKSSPYIKFWYLACSLSLWKSNTHLQTGKVCSLFVKKWSLTILGPKSSRTGFFEACPHRMHVSAVSHGAHLPVELVWLTPCAVA